MKRHLVIGASGMVGEHLVLALNAIGQNPIATCRSNQIPSAIPLDITNRSDVDSLFASEQPMVTFLPAALTNVDYCETYPDESYKTNVMGVQNVVNVANSADSRVIYFSTDYIFDGRKGPYSEEEPANPISEYGRQKLAAEHYISLFSKKYLIIRTTIVYGWERQGKNFVARLVKSLRENVPVKAPVDQIGSPTYANNLAQIAVELSESDRMGVVNVTGPSCVDRHAFARAAARAFHLDESLIVAVKTEELHQPAKRPLNAGLNTTKISEISKTSLTAYFDGLDLMAKEEKLLHNNGRS